MVFFKHNFSKIQEINSRKLIEKEIRLFMKRDDLLHPNISGNKWRKLKYNMLQLKQEQKTTLLTFGGAFSNHIAATAAAGSEFGVKTIGIIRGEKHSILNPTLQYATDCGMLLKYISRKAYKEKDSPIFQEQLRHTYGDIYILPEGGTNEHALLGCAEIIQEVAEQNDGGLPDYFCVSCGTGGTISGMITGLNNRSKVLGFSVLKGDFLKEEVNVLVHKKTSSNFINWQINTDYHCGGYAKFTPELIAFINQFKVKHHIALDPIYTGKMMLGIFDLIDKDYFAKGSSILAIHTGGLQGIAGFNQRFGNILK